VGEVNPGGDPGRKPGTEEPGSEAEMTASES